MTPASQRCGLMGGGVRRKGLGTACGSKAFVCGAQVGKGAYRPMTPTMNGIQAAMMSTRATEGTMPVLNMSPKV